MKGHVFRALVLVLCSAAGCSRNDDPARIGTAHPVRSEWGAVLAGEEARKLLDTCSRPRPRGLSREWTPSRHEIESLEAGLTVLLEQKLARVILESGQMLPRPADYYRQYAGFYRGSRRVVYVNGLHRSVIEVPRQDPASWTRTAMGLCDGGLMGFGIVYDVERNSFGPIEFDGGYAGPVRERWF